MKYVTIILFLTLCFMSTIKADGEADDNGGGADVGYEGADANLNNATVPNEGDTDNSGAENQTNQDPGENQPQGTGTVNVHSETTVIANQVGTTIVPFTIVQPMNGNTGQTALDQRIVPSEENEEGANDITKLKSDIDELKIRFNEMLQVVEKLSADISRSKGNLSGNQNNSDGGTPMNMGMNSGMGGYPFGGYGGFPFDPYMMHPFNSAGLYQGHGSFLQKSKKAGAAHHQQQNPFNYILNGGLHANYPLSLYPFV